MSNKSFIILLGVVVIGFIAYGISTSKTGVHHLANAQTVAVTNKPLVPSSFTTVNNNSVSLARYKGKKLMVYLLATWCSSCQASLVTMLKNATTLQKDGLEVIILETYGDAGYPGPSMQQFISDTTTTKSIPSNFIFGQASQALTTSYNPNNTPDIYYLINQSGVVKDVSSTPSATISTILRFAKEEA